MLLFSSVILRLFCIFIYSTVTPTSRKCEVNVSFSLFGDVLVLAVVLLQDLMIAVRVTF